MKIAFIIPGFGYSGKEKEYQKIAGFFKNKDIKPIVIHIRWKRHTFSEYVEEARRQIVSQSALSDELYLLGFSFGAMITFVLSSELRFEKQILCSLSPYFKEDMPKIKKWWRNMLGKRRTEEFEKLSFAKIAQKTDCETTVLYGNQEGVEVERRAVDTGRKIRNSRLVVLAGVRHDISDKRYLVEIENIIKEY